MMKLKNVWLFKVCFKCSIIISKESYNQARIPFALIELNSTHHNFCKNQVIFLRNDILFTFKYT